MESELEFQYFAESTESREKSSEKECLTNKSEDNNVDRDYEFQIKPSPSRSISTGSATSQNAKLAMSRSHLESEAANASSESVKSQKPVLDPFKDIMKESELLVKIADLGNACWTVSFKMV